MADLVAFIYNFDPPEKKTILMFFAGTALIFDLLGVESLSNMKWEVKLKLKGAPASKFLLV